MGVPASWEVVIDASARREEFEAFVAARSGALLRTAYLLAGDKHAAEDLLQTSLAKTYLAWPRIKDMQSVEAFVRRTLVTTNISTWRKHRDREVLMPLVPVLAHNPRTDAVDQRLSLWPHICALPPRQRTVMVLRYYEDLTEAETARLMGCSIGAVKRYCARALRTSCPA